MIIAFLALVVVTVGTMSLRRCSRKRFEHAVIDFYIKIVCENEKN